MKKKKKKKKYTDKTEEGQRNNKKRKGARHSYISTRGNMQEVALRAIPAPL